MQSGPPQSQSGVSQSPMSQASHHPEPLATASPTSSSSVIGRLVLPSCARLRAAAGSTPQRPATNSRYSSGVSLS